MNCFIGESPINGTILEGWILASQIWGSSLSVIGLCTNLLAIIIILWQIYLGRNPRRTQITPYIHLDGYTLLLLNLCICDLLYSGISLPLTAYTYSYPLKHQEPTCNFCTFAAVLRYWNALVEWLTLAVIALQRCVDIRRSRHRRFFKPKPTFIIIGILWIIGAVPQLAQIGSYGFDKTTWKCDVMPGRRRILFFSLEAGIPLVIMVFACSRIIYYIWKNVKTLRDRGMSEKLVKERRKDMMKSVKLLLALVTLFFVCVLPICIQSLIANARNHIDVKADMSVFMIYWTQYGLNVFLYVVRNDDFKAACKQFFSVIFRKGSGPTGSALHQGASSCRNVNTVSHISGNAVLDRSGSSLQFTKAEFTENQDHPNSVVEPTALPQNQSSQSMSFMV